MVFSIPYAPWCWNIYLPLPPKKCPVLSVNIPAPWSIWALWIPCVFPAMVSSQKLEVHECWPPASRAGVTQNSFANSENSSKKKQQRWWCQLKLGFLSVKNCFFVVGKSHMGIEARSFRSFRVREMPSISPWRILTVLLYMVCHGSHQYTPVIVSICWDCKWL